MQITSSHFPWLNCLHENGYDVNSHVTIVKYSYILYVYVDWWEHLRVLQTAVELKASIVVPPHWAPYIYHKSALEAYGTVVHRPQHALSYLWRKNRFDKCLFLLLLFRRQLCRFTKAVFRLNGILSYLGIALFWKALKVPKFSIPNNLTNEYVVFWLQNVPRVCFFVTLWNYHAMFGVSCKLMNFAGFKTLFR